MAGDRLGCADRFDELGDGLFGQVAGDVGFADQAQQSMIFDDGQPADLVFFHHAEHLFDAGPGPDMIGAALGELAGGGGVGVMAGGDALMTMSRSVIIPVSRSSSPKIGNAPTPRSRMCCAAAVSVSCSPIQVNPVCMTSLAVVMVSS